MTNTTPAPGIEEANEPTIDDLIAHQQRLLEDYQVNPVVTLIAKSILTTLRAHKAIMEAEMPEPVAKRYEFDIDNKNKAFLIREKADGRFMLAEEVLDLLAAEKLKLAKVMEALRESMGYLKHRSSCDMIANGIDGDCLCGLFLHMEKSAALLSELGKTTQEVARGDTPC